MTLDQASGTTHREIFTDNSGQFTLGSLPPGKYRLVIFSPGFVEQVREVELGTSQVARADSQLATGSVSETVSVEGAASALNTESAPTAVPIAGSSNASNHREQRLTIPHTRYKRQAVPKQERR